MSYEILSSPMKIGKCEIRNRIVMKFTMELLLIILETNVECSKPKL